MSAHTPGPWVQDRWGSIIANGETLLVSGVALPCGNHPNAEEAKANTRLIAAAPELLEALALAHDHLAVYHEALDGTPSDVLAQIRAVLDKATGFTA